MGSAIWSRAHAIRSDRGVGMTARSCVVRLVVTGALAAFSMFSGCDWGPVRIYVQSDASVAFGDRGGHHGFDGAVPDDVATGDDAGVAAPDVGPDGAVPDAEIDAGPVDAAVGGDVGSTDGGPVGCAPGAQLTYGLSPLNTSGDTSYSETVQVTFKGISLPGGTCNLMKFDAWGSPQYMEFCYNLPFGYEIPVAEGETVKLEVVQDMPGECCLGQRIYIWDQDNNPRFYYYVGDPQYFEPYSCADPKYCPAAWFYNADCAPAEEVCGTTVHPPVRFSMGGQWCDQVLQQGQSLPYVNLEDGCVKSAAGRLVVAESFKVEKMLCADYPDAQIAAMYFDNSKVSQCFCLDHDDCALGDVCETERHRCVTNACLCVECVKGQGYECNPYTGECVQPLKDPFVKCEWTADCQAAGSGVCNTFWKDLYGFGICEHSKCEAMDCMAGLCAPLMNVCYECLSDCDCYVPEGPNGKCDLVTRTCNPQ